MTSAVRAAGLAAGAGDAAVVTVVVRVVFRDLQTYAITLRDRGIGMAGLREVAQDLAFGFARSQE